MSVCVCAHICLCVCVCVCVMDMLCAICVLWYECVKIGLTVQNVVHYCFRFQMAVDVFDLQSALIHLMGAGKYHVISLVGMSWLLW